MGENGGNELFGRLLRWFSRSTRQPKSEPGTSIHVTEETQEEDTEGLGTIFNAPESVSAEEAVPVYEAPAESLQRQDKRSPHQPTRRSRISFRTIEEDTEAAGKNYSAPEPIVVDETASIPEAAAEFSHIRTEAPIDLILGVDFGTSATKVVIRAPYVAGTTPYALPIPEPLRAEESPHLWRSAIWVDPTGMFHLTPVLGAVEIEDIKANLIEEPSRPLLVLDDGRIVSARDAATAYLAYVFRNARARFLEEKHAIYGGATTLWQSNVGLPAATYDDQALVEFYRRTVAAAWLLSQESDEITLESVRRANDHPSAIAAAWDQYEREKLGIEVIPEVAAEVVGFARSTRRREGLYALVDVGAGTVDVCTFRLHAPTPGMDRYSMFIADVQPQGAAVLREWSASGNPIAEFRKQVDRTIRGCIWNTKRLRDSTAREWRKGLPVFLCGGGRASDFYKGAAKDIGPWLFMHTGARQLPTLALDVPEEFDAQTERSNFHRLAVAWGLSYQKFDIGELQAPNEIENMPAGRVRDFIGSYVSKDQM